MDKRPGSGQTGGAVHTVDVDVPLGDGARLNGALATPERPRGAPAPGGPYPGVVVLHELFGLNDDMRRICGRFAAAGYVAMAPDLYSHGNRGLCLTRTLLAGVAGRNLDGVLDDIEGAATALAARDDVDGARIAVVGFCMGGGFALAYAARCDRPRAAAVHYGAVPADRGELAGVCPVVASYGAADRTFAPHAARLEQHLAGLGVPHDVKVYEGVGHSFMSYDNAPGWLRWTVRLPSPMRPGYDDEAAEDAWQRMLAFFDEHLRDGR